MLKNLNGHDPGVSGIMETASAVSSPVFQCTVIKSTDQRVPVLTKKIELNGNGGVSKSSVAYPATTKAETVEMPLDKMPEFISSLEKDKALVHGINNDAGNKPYSIVKSGREQPEKRIYARSKQWMKYPEHALIMIDIDEQTEGRCFPHRDVKTDDVLTILNDVVPGFKDAAKLIVPSTSAGIYAGDELMTSDSNVHVYLFVKDGSDIERFGKTLLKRLWLAGHGHIALNKIGSMLERCIIDTAVFSPERLDFVAGPILGDGLTEKKTEPKYIDGGYLDTTALLDLTPEEEQLYNAKVEHKKNDPDCILASGRQFETAVKEHSQKTKKPIEESRRIIESRRSGDLHMDDEIVFQNINKVTVKDILADPSRFESEPCGDPNEPEQGLCRAMCFINSGKGDQKPIIRSFLHGGQTFFLPRSKPVEIDDFEDQIEAEETENTEVEGIVDWIEDSEQKEILIHWKQKAKDLSDIGQTIVIEAIQKKTGIGKQPLKADLKKYIGKIRKAERQQRELERSEKLKEKGITEIDYFEAFPGRCVLALCNALARLPKSKAVYRFGDKVVSVIDGIPTSVRMVKHMHDAGGQYPLMALIKEHSVESLRLKIEKVAVLYGQTNRGERKQINVPRLILKGLMDYQEQTAIKPLVGVCEHPFVDESFKPVTRQGYDPRTGLFIKFDDNLKFEFNNPIGKKEAEDAYKFLTDEVLADFPFESDLDQAAAVSALLAAMQRKMIHGDSGCPGYLFDAPVQSSGKTTLAQIISYSIYNRPAAATSWADNDEEIGKHLLAILMEGHSCVLFDNLPEGARIESNELAKAMTSATYRKRQLGHNVEVMAPSQVLWLFSGNNVMPCGDFNTRILPIRLDPKMANPDKRTFKRRDIGQWCQQHRPEIIKACLTILIGSLSMSKSTTPTRYPEWERYVRDPIFYVSGLNIAELFDRNKENDPKLEGQRIFLEAWYDAFGTAEKSSKQVLETANHNYNINASIVDIFGGILPSTFQLSSWLRKLKDRIIGGYKIVSVKGEGIENHNKKCWILEKIES